MTEERIVHPGTGEEYTRFVLDCGLQVLCRPMAGYTVAHAVYATDFGSVDRDFSLNGEVCRTPAGVAHFLEHKMFENEDGQDAFELYAETGASANAFTSFDKTCYIFTASERIEESLDILLSFVSKPFFTDATVSKEQGIIGQEIKMYDDNPGWRLLFTLLDCLYVDCPVKADIAGTVESIAEITPEILYRCTDAFYCPHNMVLAVAGNITCQQVLEACARAGLCVKAAPQVCRLPVREPVEIHKPFARLEMQVSRPIVGVGYKVEPPLPEERERAELMADMLTDLIAGDMTPLYRKLYDEGQISPDFEGEFLSGDGYFSILFSGEATDPALVRGSLLDEVARLQKEGLDDRLFTACKNRFYGEAITELESPEAVATGLASSAMRGQSYFKSLDVLAALTREDLEQALRLWLRPEASAWALIYPAEVKK